MKRIAVVFICFICTIGMLFSCRNKDSYDFLHDTSEIESIAIVNISVKNDGSITEKEQTVISDIDSFLDDFLAIDCFVWLSDPIGISETCKFAIKIIYQNGEYELIDWNGQAEYTANKGFRNYVGYRTFDEQQFRKLIDNYLVSGGSQT